MSFALGDVLPEWEATKEEFALLELLSEGVTDEVVMGRLGWSRRTFERRLRGAMDKVEARSRFQLGFRFAELRLQGQSDTEA